MGLCSLTCQILLLLQLHSPSLALSFQQLLKDGQEQDHYKDISYEVETLFITIPVVQNIIIFVMKSMLRTIKTYLPKTGLQTTD